MKLEIKYNIGETFSLLNLFSPAEKKEIVSTLKVVSLEITSSGIKYICTDEKENKIELLNEEEKMFDDKNQIRQFILKTSKLKLDTFEEKETPYLCETVNEKMLLSLPFELKEKDFNKLKELMQLSLIEENGVFKLLDLLQIKYNVLRLNNLVFSI